MRKATVVALALLTTGCLTAPTMTPEARWIQCVEAAHDSPYAGDAIYQACDQAYGEYDAR